MTKKIFTIMFEAQTTKELALACGWLVVTSRKINKNRRPNIPSFSGK